MPWTPDKSEQLDTVYLWLILLVAAGFCPYARPNTHTQTHTHTISPVTHSHLPLPHTHSPTQCGAALLKWRNLRSDAAILLQFSHAQLPLDHTAPRSLPAGSYRGGTKRGKRWGNRKRDKEGDILLSITGDREWSRDKEKPKKEKKGTRDQKAGKSGWKREEAKEWIQWRRGEEKYRWQRGDRWMFKRTWGAPSWQSQRNGGESQQGGDSLREQISNDRVMCSYCLLCLRW